MISKTLLTPAAGLAVLSAGACSGGDQWTSDRTLAGEAFRAGDYPAAERQLRVAVVRAATERGLGRAGEASRLEQRARRMRGAPEDLAS